MRPGLVRLNRLAPLSALALLFASVLLFVSRPAFAAPAAGNPGYREYSWTDAARNRELRVAAWYPTPETALDMHYGPFPGHAAVGAKMADGKYPLLLFSHGSGGHRFNQYYLAEFLSAHGYIILSVQHPGNNTWDNKDAGTPRNLRNRPKDISFVLDRALAESGLAEHVDSARIGAAGHSMGGYTALVLMGAVPHVGGKPFDTTLSDPRIHAAVLMAPGVPELFDKAAMAELHGPVLLVLSGSDEILHGREQAYRDYLPPDTDYLEFPEAGHFVYLMDCPPDVAKNASHPCNDFGTPRSEIHPMLEKAALEFFDSTLRSSE